MIQTFTIKSMFRGIVNYVNSSVIKQKGESQNGGNKKNHANFSEKTNISYPLILTRTCAYQGIRNTRGFFGKFSVLFFSCYLRFDIRPFTLLPTNFNTKRSFISYVRKIFQKGNNLNPDTPTHLGECESNKCYFFGKLCVRTK